MSGAGPKANDVEIDQCISGSAEMSESHCDIEGSDEISYLSLDKNVSGSR